MLSSGDRLQKKRISIMNKYDQSINDNIEYHTRGLYRWDERKHREESVRTLEQLVLPQMDTLDDVAAVVENPPNVLGVDGTCEMGIAVMTVVACRRWYPQKFSSNKIFGLHYLWVVWGLEQSVGWELVVGEFGEVLLQLVSTGLDFLRQQILFIKEENHGDSLQPTIVPDVPEECQTLL